MSTKTETKHTPTPWDPYPKTSVRFVQLSLGDYRHAVHCVNAHDDLLAALEDARQVLRMADRSDAWRE